MCAYYVYIKVDKGFTLWFDSVITKRPREEGETNSSAGEAALPGPAPSSFSGS